MNISMLLRTLKLFVDCSNRNKYVLSVVGDKTGYSYSFVMYDNSLVCNITNIEKNEFSSDTGLSFPIVDIEGAKLPDTEFHLKKLSEFQYTSLGEDYETCFVKLKNEATLFLKLFRIMKEYVNFTIMSNGKYVDCVFLYGKVYFVEETDDTIILHQTKIYSLCQIYRKYRIVNVSPSLKMVNASDFINRYKRIAIAKGKNFNLNRFGTKSRWYGSGQ